MKLKSIVMVALLSFGSAFGGNCGCSMNLIAKLAQDILDGIDIIKPTVINISNQINIDVDIILSAIENISCSIGDVVITATVDLTPIINVTISIGDIIISDIEEINNNISINDSIIISLLEDISTRIDCCASSTCDLTPIIDVTVSIGDILISEIDVINNNISINDSTIISLLEDISTRIDCVSSATCNLDPILIEISINDEIINSKIGDLSDPGSCLESMIDVPDDINNLNLSIIALLKTILLELRGCGGC